MGRPYESDIIAFPDTYNWAMNADVSVLIDSVASSAARPLLAIGSGGAQSVAAFVTALHESFCGRFAKPLTPLMMPLAPLHEASALVLSAGGRNPDILGCFRRLLELEPAVLSVACLRSDSPLGRLARKRTHVHLAEYDFPRKDGFVATNSVLALSILLWRAYAAAFGAADFVREVMDPVLKDPETFASKRSCVERAFEAVAGSEHFVVLHGSTTVAAAVDLESKFSEAALGSVQLTDYRNFAHGRHHWIAKRRQNTGVIAFVTEEDRGLASRTLALLPTDTRICLVDVRGTGISSSLESLLTAQLLAGEAGKSIGVDPGRPGVPEFGRRLFRLNAWSNSAAAPNVRTAAVRRKHNSTPIPVIAQKLNWTEALGDFVGRLHEAKFSGIVFDYDGTLCERQDRFLDLPKPVGRHLCRLLANGILLGVATGRGASVRAALRNTLPKKVWHKICVGYYNCSQIGLLADDRVPERLREPAKAIQRAAKFLLESPELRSCATVEMRGEQIVVFPLLPGLSVGVQRLVEQLIATEYREGLACVHSTHSVDVVTPAASKLRLVDRLQSELTIGKSVLCIGDLGAWPGNDFELLSGPYGLSTSEVSPSPTRCWNLAPAGIRNVQATTFYLERLNLRRGYFTVDTPRILGA